MDIYDHIQFDFEMSWIGYRDTDQTTTCDDNMYFAWIDGYSGYYSESYYQHGYCRTEISESGYNNWGYSQPNDTSTDICVAISYSNGKWYDDACTENKYYICSIR